MGRTAVRRPDLQSAPNGEHTPKADFVLAVGLDEVQMAVTVRGGSIRLSYQVDRRRKPHCKNQKRCKERSHGASAEVFHCRAPRRITFL
jgi:hypothetical protein